MPAADELFRTTAGNGTLLQGTRGEDDGPGGRPDQGRGEHGAERSADRADRSDHGERVSAAGRLRSAAPQAAPGGSGAGAQAGSRGVGGAADGDGRGSASSAANGSASKNVQGVGSAESAAGPSGRGEADGQRGAAAGTGSVSGAAGGGASSEGGAARPPSGAPLPSQGPATPPAPARKVSAPRRPSGRERHDEKITVYVSPDELLGLERARITLRGEYGVAVDRGRIVREAVAALLADLDARGPDSILVKRLSSGG